MGKEGVQIDPDLLSLLSLEALASTHAIFSCNSIVLVSFQKSGMSIFASVFSVPS